MWLLRCYLHNVHKNMCFLCCVHVAGHSLPSTSLKWDLFYHWKEGSSNQMAVFEVDHLCHLTWSHDSSCSCNDKMATAITTQLTPTQNPLNSNDNCNYSKRAQNNPGIGLMDTWLPVFTESRPRPTTVHAEWHKMPQPISSSPTVRLGNLISIVHQSRFAA